MPEGGPVPIGDVIEELLQKLLPENLRAELNRNRQQLREDTAETDAAYPCPRRLRLGRYDRPFERQEAEVKKERAERLKDRAGKFAKKLQ